MWTSIPRAAAFRFVHHRCLAQLTLQGLPPEWEKLLQSSGITQDDVKENSDAVLDILEFGSQYMEQEAKEKKRQEAAAAAAAHPSAGQRKPTHEEVHPPASNGSTATPATTNTDDGQQAAAPLPEERTITLSDLINKSDPTKVYPNPKKIGTT